MATAPVKSPLHNFPLPFLKWGGGKNHASGSHRCRRTISADSSPVADHCEAAAEAERNESSEAEPSRAHRVGSRTVRNRFAAPFASCSVVAAEKKESDEDAGGEGKEGNDREAAEEEEAAMMVQKPWNLRPRKALFSKAAPIGSKSGELQEPEAVGAGGGHQNENLNQLPLKSMRLRGLSETQQSSEKKEKRKFWIALSREEIEEDIFVMTGSRPARRPRKRPKNVQKQLDACFPGLWLVGITADAYRIADAPVKR